MPCSLCILPSIFVFLVFIWLQKPQENAARPFEWETRNLRAAGQTGGGANAGTGSQGSYPGGVVPPGPPGPSPPPPSPPPSDLAQGLYFDFGYLFGVGIYDVLGYDNQGNPYLDVTLATTYYLPILQNAQTVGCDRIYLAFAQLYDILKLVSLDPDQDALFGGDTYIDGLDGLYNPAPAPFYTKTKPIQDFLTLFVSLASSLNLEVILSFGGNQGNQGNGGYYPWTFPTSGKETATAVLNYMEMYNFSGVDFDIEDTSFFDSNDQSERDAFFQELVSEKTWISLTVEGEADNPDDPYVNLIQYADVVQLMLYDVAGGHQTVSSNYIQGWIRTTGNSKLLSIGFDTDTNYNNVNQSCTEQCPPIPPNTTNGVAAEMTYIYALSNLKPPLVPTDFQGTFWWMDCPLNFQSTTSNEFLTVDDFWTSLTTSSLKSKSVNSPISTTSLFAHRSRRKLRSVCAWPT